MTAYDAIHDDAAWLDLSDRSRLMVTGEDAGRLLHALSSNDIKNLPNGEGLYAFFLSAQGRILADASIYHRGEVFFLDTEPEIGVKLRDHIDKYIIADDAAVEVVGGWGELSIEGPNAFQHVADLGIPVPDKIYSSCAWAGGFTARTASCTTDGVRIFGPAERIAALGGVLRMPQLSPEEARIVRLENGIPRYGEDITERYLVQETARLNAVHFNKGCYLGQEIVERVRSRAQVHRHLHPVWIETTTVPSPGTKLTYEAGDAGEITSAAYSPRFKKVIALAYIRTDALNNKPKLKIAGTGSEAYLLIELA